MTEYDDSKAIYSVELEFIAEVMAWAAKSPENEYFWVRDVIIQDRDGIVIGRVVTGDELRYEPVKK